MNAIKGDFIGFTYDGIHSSELGLMRISDGSRYTDNLLPTFSDKTLQIPGADGTYYIDSFYTQKPFSFPVGFDGVTEEQLHRIKTLLGKKGIHTLIFDETPYKVYKVKPTGTPNLKYVAFDSDRISYDRTESNKVYDKAQLYRNAPMFYSDRIYKGEGQLTFVAYTPFARSRYKYLNYYDEINIPEWRSGGSKSEVLYSNLNEWQKSVGFVPSWFKKTINGQDYQIDVASNASGATSVLVKNFGDIDTPFKLIFDTRRYVGVSIPNFIVSYTDINGDYKYLEFDAIGDLVGDDVAFQINTELHLVEGLIEKDGALIPSGNLYNKYITGGDFFKISAQDDFKLISCDDNFGADVSIEYDYLFY